jgi:hemerythrin
MFGFMQSKTQKLVSKWSDEHQEIVRLAGAVVHAYTVHDEKKAKKALTDLSGLASSHFMDEDLEFFKLKRTKKIPADVEASITEFVEGFKKTKLSLMTFLAHYSHPDTELTPEFFEEFNGIIEAVAGRIEFEENNLYELLNRS